MGKLKSKICTIMSLVYLFTLTPITAFAESKADPGVYDNEYVQTIDFNQFNKNIEEDELMLTVKKTLLNANKFALGNWFKNKKLDLDTGTYYNLYLASGNSTVPEYIYRFPAAQAFGIAISLKTGAYDENYIQVNKEQAKAIAIKLATSVAYAHKANGGNFKSWGDDWQAAHWAYYAGYAAWLLWDDMNDEQKGLIRNMIIYEANRFENQNALYWKTTSGKELYAGDSKIEEDSWNSELLNLAYQMLPKHENSKKWEYRMIEYQLAAFSNPQMNESTEMLHGKMAKEWVNGYNVQADGTVINHGIIHPLYNAASTGVNTSIVNSLLKKDLPLAAKYNLDTLYSGLADKKFDSPPYMAPGGTMYIDGSADVYYPQGTDWGTGIYDAYANIDVSAYVYGYNKNAYGWAMLHAKKVLEQQNRFTDGHTYASNAENNYAGREEAITMRMGNAYMTLWLNKQVELKFSNDAVEYPHKDLPALDENQEYVFAGDSTYVRGGTNASTSYYPTDIMEVKNDGGEVSSNTREGYLKFDLTNIKNYPKSAKLYLPVKEVGANVQAAHITNTIEYVDDNSWSEESLTFGNKPKKTGKEITTWSPSADGLTIDISDYVKSAYASDGKLSLRIFSKTNSGGDTFVRYGTSRQADPNYRPRLMLTYGDEMQTFIKGTSQQKVGDTYDLTFAVNNASSISDSAVKFEYDPSVFQVDDIYSNDVEIKDFNNSFAGKTLVKINNRQSISGTIDLVHFKVKALSLTNNSSIKAMLMDSNNNTVSESIKDIVVSQTDYSSNKISLIDKIVENSTAIADTFVKDGDNTAASALANGTKNELDCKEYITTGQTRQAFIKFELPSIDKLDSIDNIKLSFYVDRTPSNGTTKYRFQYIPENNWSETTLTWNTKPNSVKNIGPSVGTIPPADANTLYEFNIIGAGFVTFDVTAKVKELVNNGQTQMSLFLYGLTSSNTSIVLQSRETAFNKPSMKIQYKYDYKPALTLNSISNVKRYEDVNVVLHSKDIKDVNDAVIMIPYDKQFKFMGVESLIDGLNVEVLEDLPNRLALHLKRNTNIDFGKFNELLNLKFKAVETGNGKISVSARTSDNSTMNDEINIEVDTVNQKVQELNINGVDPIRSGEIFIARASLKNVEPFSNYAINTQYDNSRFELIDVNSKDMKFNYGEKNQLSSLIGTTGNQDSNEIIFTFRALPDKTGESSIKFTISNEDGVSISKDITPVDITQLSSAIQRATEILNSVVVGDGEGQYSQSKINALTAAIETAQKVADNNLASQKEVDEAVKVLNKAVDIFLDKTAPTTEINVSGAEKNNWYSSDVAITLTAKDDLSGVDYTEYRIGTDKEWTAYKDKITLSEEGIFTIQYRSKDEAGNVENIKEKTVRIDKSSPSFAFTVNGNVLAEGASFADSKLLNFTVSDNLSGVYYGEVVIDGRTYRLDAEHGLSVNMDFAGKTGTHIATINIEDAAGNKIQKNFSFEVTTCIESISTLINRYKESGELNGPLAVQLTNNLEQAKHQLDIGHQEQAAKHMEDFQKHLDNTALESLVSDKAKEVLNADAKALIGLWKK